MGVTMRVQRRFKRRRGQIRAIDFIVSLLLFLLMLSQLVLIVVSVLAGIKVSTTGGVTAEELDIFARTMLQERGDLEWGYQRILPTTFGLGSDVTTTSLTLDPAKIARLVTGTTFPISQLSGYTTFDYTTLKEVIRLSSGLEFQLALLPSLETSVEVAILDSTNDTNIITVATTNSHAIPISGAQADFFTVDLTTGIVYFAGTAITNSTGYATQNYLVPNVGILEAEHIVVSIVEKGAMWGMNWGYIDMNPAFRPAEIGGSSSTTVWGGGVNSSALLISDLVALSPDQHYISVLYQDTHGGYSNTTLDLTTTTSGNATISIPTSGIVVYFSIARITDVYQVAIGSYPTILDRTQATGIFYNVFGNLGTDTLAESRLSKTYPVVVRQLLMRCTVTLWSG